MKHTTGENLPVMRATFRDTFISSLWRSNVDFHCTNDVHKLLESWQMWNTNQPSTSIYYLYICHGIYICVSYEYIMMFTWSEYTCINFEQHASAVLRHAMQITGTKQNDRGSDGYSDCFLFVCKCMQVLLEVLVQTCFEPADFSWFRHGCNVGWATGNASMLLFSPRFFRYTNVLCFSAHLRGPIFSKFEVDLCHDNVASRSKVQREMQSYTRVCLQLQPKSLCGFNNLATSNLHSQHLSRARHMFLRTQLFPVALCIFGARWRAGSKK